MLRPHPVLPGAPVTVDPLDPLRLALGVSPDNLPLRRHLADALLERGHLDEAEEVYRDGLAMTPADRPLRLGLASTFFRQGKHDQALVLVEALLEEPEPAPRAFLLAARLLLVTGEHEQAVDRYRTAVSLDLGLADEDLAERLGVVVPASPFPGQAEPLMADDRDRMVWDDPASIPAVDLAERPTITFADVGGMDQVKDEIRIKVIHPLGHPELYRAYGKAIGGGILMYGPPGCGKTHLARATAGEVGAGFVAVGIDQVLDMWIGSSERNLHAIFERARRSRPCVLFFDEVDALGASRADLRASAGRHLINQFLAELDGVQHANEGVLVLAATNAPWYLDSAFRRPGRFDRVLFVPPPGAPARAAILRILCRDKPTGEIDYDHVAGRTAGFSGADLKAVVDLAVEARLREAIKAGVLKPLTAKDLTSAAKRVKPSTREWFANARNYALYANQGGLYDDLLPYLERR
jgi:transitional endoplasmic reticulum ATPase